MLVNYLLFFFSNELYLLLCRQDWILLGLDLVSHCISATYINRWLAQARANIMS